MNWLCFIFGHSPKSIWQDPYSQHPICIGIECKRCGDRSLDEGYEGYQKCTECDRWSKHSGFRGRCPYC